MKKTKLPKSLLVLLLAPALLAFVLPAGRLLAQSQTETKIRLMADGLRARDSGDLETAKKSWDELLAIAPNDATVQRLLGGVNAQLAARSTGTAVADAAPAAVPAGSEPVEVKLPKPDAVAKVQTPDQAAASQADALAKQENQRLKGLIAAARSQSSTARGQAKQRLFDDAAGTLDAAIKSLPVNPATTEVIADLEAEKHGLLLEKAQYYLAQGDTDKARAALEDYSQVVPDSKKAVSLGKTIDRVELTPPLQPIEKINPKFVADQKEIAKLMAKGRSQYLAGDVDGAQETLRLVEAFDSGNAEAKSIMARIASEKAAVGVLNREKTRAQMVEEVAKAWQRPGVYLDKGGVVTTKVESLAITKKLSAILLPSVNFAGVELSKVVSTLTNLTVEYDKSESADKGINIMLLDPSNKNPGVNITIKSNTSLKRTLDFITESIGYQYEIQADAIVIRPGGETSSLDTVFFPITRATVIRMTGVGSAAASATPAAAADPFAAAATTGGSSGGSSGGGESQAVRAFLQQAGVDFEGTPKSSLAYDGAALIVTQTSRNIDRIRNILNRYNDVKQVEIETKFMEVQEGALDELGVNWTAAGHGVPQFDSNTGAPLLGSDGKQLMSYNQNYQSTNRSIASAFAGSSTAGSGSIVQQTSSISTTGTGASAVTTITPGSISTTPIINNAPTLPGSVNLGAGVSPLGVITGTLGEFNVSATIRALSQKSGTDLLSAPKVTVLSGNSANIIIAQEMRYPQSYGEVQSQVGSSGNSSNGGSAGVTITAGTPQEFTTRNVGVELKVTPTVEEDDYSISLDLNPKVTEFEGFVEYGGQSVAVTQSTTVTVPSGFFQPIFSTREITTKVTVWDGATLVMGGLTREEVKKSSDKVPILGDIPFIGRAFRSKGESTQKRNLLIFVTANLVSPGGSPKKQQLKSVAPSSMFQNPTLVTPASSESRVRGN